MTLKDFGLVAVGEGKSRKVVVMLTTSNGLYRGSYDQIMSDKKANQAAYTVKVNGQKIDTRQAMTWDLYQAFITQAEADGTHSLPDSVALAEDNDEPWTATWLTGEPAVGLDARYGRVPGGRPNRFWDRRDDDWGVVRVRPAAVI